MNQIEMTKYMLCPAVDTKALDKTIYFIEKDMKNVRMNFVIAEPQFLVLWWLILLESCVFHPR